MQEEINKIYNLMMPDDVEDERNDLLIFSNLMYDSHHFGVMSDDDYKDFLKLEATLKKGSNGLFDDYFKDHDMIRALRAPQRETIFDEDKDVNQTLKPDDHVNDIPVVEGGGKMLVINPVASFPERFDQLYAPLEGKEEIKVVVPPVHVVGTKTFVHPTQLVVAEPSMPVVTYPAHVVGDNEDVPMTIRDPQGDLFVGVTTPAGTYKLIYNEYTLLDASSSSKDVENWFEVVSKLLEINGRAVLVNRKIGNPVPSSFVMGSEAPIEGAFHMHESCWPLITHFKYHSFLNLRNSAAKFGLNLIYDLGKKTTSARKANYGKRIYYTLFPRKNALVDSSLDCTFVHPNTYDQECSAENIVAVGYFGLPVQIRINGTIDKVGSYSYVRASFTTVQGNEALYLLECSHAQAKYLVSKGKATAQGFLYPKSKVEQNDIVSPDLINVVSTTHRGWNQRYAFKIFFAQWIQTDEFLDQFSSEDEFVANRIPCIHWMTGYDRTFLKLGYMRSKDILYIRSTYRTTCTLGNIINTQYGIISESTFRRAPPGIFQLSKINNTLLDKNYLTRDEQFLCYRTDHKTSLVNVENICIPVPLFYQEEFPEDDSHGDFVLDRSNWTFLSDFKWSYHYHLFNPLKIDLTSLDIRMTAIAILQAGLHTLAHEDIHPMHMLFLRAHCIRMLLREKTSLLSFSDLKAMSINQFVARALNVHRFIAHTDPLAHLQDPEFLLGLQNLRSASFNALKPAVKEENLRSLSPSAKGVFAYFYKKIESVSKSGVCVHVYKFVGFM